MARTLEAIAAARPQADLGRLQSTTEQDIRRQMLEDGEDPEAVLGRFIEEWPSQPGKRLVRDKTA